LEDFLNWCNKKARRTAVAMPPKSSAPGPSKKTEAKKKEKVIEVSQRGS